MKISKKIELIFDTELKKIEKEGIGKTYSEEEVTNIVMKHIEDIVNDKNRIYRNSSI